MNLVGASPTFTAKPKCSLGLAEPAVCCGPLCARCPVTGTCLKFSGSFKDLSGVVRRVRVRTRVRPTHPLASSHAFEKPAGEAASAEDLLFFSFSIS